MAEFAFSSPAWAFGSAERRWWDLEEMWGNLMGMDAVLASMWTAQQQPLVARAKDMYQRWADLTLARPRSTVVFARFLQQPAAQAILLDGLLWLDRSLARADDHFWREHYLEETLASLLDHCWRTCRVDLRRHNDVFAAFRSLLRALADRQHPIALELLDRVTRELLPGAER